MTGALDRPAGRRLLAVLLLHSALTQVVTFVLESVHAVAVALVPEPVEGLGEQAVVGGSVDGGMESPVVLQLLERGVAGQRLEAGQHRADLRQLLLGPAARGQ